jgi:hypothetical protein
MITKHNYQQAFVKWLAFKGKFNKLKKYSHSLIFTEFVTKMVYNPKCMDGNLKIMAVK